MKKVEIPTAPTMSGLPTIEALKTVAGNLIGVELTHDEAVQITRLTNQIQRMAWKYYTVHIK